ncbi:UNVERIFIED_CONTAM: hypothetical protein GTU68_039768 [Idotea baltica]|nr:hypothetical protein [Idotea baltica]
MKNLLNKLFEHHTLTKEEASDAIKDIVHNSYHPNLISAFLTIYRMRNITVDELSGFRQALLELCIPIDLSAYDAIDLCGTGGDGKNTFNISTLSSFVVAGAGIKVAKHGNYGVSSISGSSNVLEHLGYTFTNKSDQLIKQIETSNICFLHAPLFHPAMKEVGPVRRALGFKTFFNMLGPLVNPSQPKKQLVGVYSLHLARMYKYIAQAHNRDLTIVHSLDGYDEISLTGDFKILRKNEDIVGDASYFNLTPLSATSIHGGETIQEAADIFIKVLKNQGTHAQNNVVIANSSLAIQCARPSQSIAECVDMASTSIKSGSAFDAFNKLLSL